MYHHSTCFRPVRAVQRVGSAVYDARYPHRNEHKTADRELKFTSAHLDKGATTSSQAESPRRQRSALTPPSSAADNFAVVCRPRSNSNSDVDRSLHWPKSMNARADHVPSFSPAHQSCEHCQQPRQHFRYQHQNPCLFWPKDERHLRDLLFKITRKEGREQTHSQPSLRKCEKAVGVGAGPSKSFGFRIYCCDITSWEPFRGRAPRKEKGGLPSIRGVPSSMAKFFHKFSKLDPLLHQQQQPFVCFC